MKKGLLLSALAVFASGLAGCGSDSSPDVPEAVLHSHGAQKSPAMQEAMRKGNPNGGPIPGAASTK